MAALMDTYARLPVAFSHGNGAYLYDEQGNKYLDALAGLAVTGLGHAHPGVTAAITRQANTLMHTSNLYRVSLQESLADRITALAGMDRVFFCNSGAEANEAAIKIARLYGHGRDINKPHVIAMEGSFHGRTMATLTATGNRKVQAGFEPLLSGFVRAPYNDVQSDRDDRREQRRSRRDSRRTDHRRRRHRRSRRRLSAGAAPHLRCEGLAADARRSADRQRPYRALFRVSAPRHPAGRRNDSRKVSPTACRSARVSRAASPRKH